MNCNKTFQSPKQFSHCWECYNTVIRPNEKNIRKIKEQEQRQILIARQREEDLREQAIRHERLQKEKERIEMQRLAAEETRRCEIAVISALSHEKLCEMFYDLMQKNTSFQDEISELQTKIDETNEENTRMWDEMRKIMSRLDSHNL